MDEGSTRARICGEGLYPQRCRVNHLDSRPDGRAEICDQPRHCTSWDRPPVFGNPRLDVQSYLISRMVARVAIACPRDGDSSVSAAVPEAQQPCGSVSKHGCVSDMRPSNLGARWDGSCFVVRQWASPARASDTRRRHLLLRVWIRPHVRVAEGGEGGRSKWLLMTRVSRRPEVSWSRSLTINTSHSRPTHPMGAVSLRIQPT